MSTIQFVCKDTGECIYVANPIYNPFEGSDKQAVLSRLLGKDTDGNPVEDKLGTEVREGIIAATGVAPTWFTLTRDVLKYGTGTVEVTLARTAKPAGVAGKRIPEPAASLTPAPVAQPDLQARVWAYMEAMPEATLAQAKEAIGRQVREEMLAKSLEHHARMTERVVAEHAKVLAAIDAYNALVGAYNEQLPAFRDLLASFDDTREVADFASVQVATA